MAKNNKEIQVLREIYKNLEDCNEIIDNGMVGAMADILLDVRKMVVNYFVFGEIKGE